jgi:hypothetical protein
VDVAVVVAPPERPANKLEAAGAAEAVGVGLAPPNNPPKVGAGAGPGVED